LSQKANDENMHWDVSMITLFQV